MCPCLYLGLLRSIYVYVICFPFSSLFSLINHKSREYRLTCYFAYFLEYVLLFLDDNQDGECE